MGGMLCQPDVAEVVGLFVSAKQSILPCSTRSEHFIYHIYINCLWLTEAERSPDPRIDEHAIQVFVGTGDAIGEFGFFLVIEKVSRLQLKSRVVSSRSMISKGTTGTAILVD